MHLYTVINHHILFPHKFSDSLFNAHNPTFTVYTNTKRYITEIFHQCRGKQHERVAHQILPVVNLATEFDPTLEALIDRFFECDSQAVAVAATFGTEGFGQRLDLKIEYKCRDSAML